MKRIGVGWVLLLSVLWLGGMATGLRAEENDEGAEAEEVEEEDTMADASQRRMSGFVRGVAESINAFFSEALRDDEDREAELVRRFYGNRASVYDAVGSHIRISPRLDWDSQSGASPNADFSAQLRVPRLSERVRLFVDSFDTDQETGNEIFSERYRRSEVEERVEGTEAGLMYLLTDGVDRRASVSGGVSFRPEPRPRVRAEARFRMDLDTWRAEFSQRVFWHMGDGFGERSRLRFDRPIGGAHQLRFTTSAVWSETSQGVDWGQSSSFFSKLGEQRESTLHVGVRGHTHPSVETDQYLMRVSYRQQTWREWLFVELETGLDFFQEDDYEAVPVAGIKLEFLFGSY